MLSFVNKMYHKYLMGEICSSFCKFFLSLRRTASSLSKEEFPETREKENVHNI